VHAGAVSAELRVAELCGALEPGIQSIGLLRQRDTDTNRQTDKARVGGRHVQ